MIDRYYTYLLTQIIPNYNYSQFLPPASPMAIVYFNYILSRIQDYFLLLYFPLIFFMYSLLIELAYTLAISEL